MRRIEAFTLLELVMAVVILGIMISYAVPRFQKAFEESKVNIATASLESIWTAQRLYKAQNTSSEFAQQLSDLSNFLDISFITSAGDSNTPFEYTTSTGTTSAEFWAKAKRRNSTYWSGSILIDSNGTLTGYIQNTKGEQITPSKM